MLIVSGECGWCEGVDWFVQAYYVFSSDSSCLAFLLAEDSPRFAGTLFYVFLCIQEVSFSYIYNDKLVYFLIISRRGVYVSRVRS